MKNSSPAGVTGKGVPAQFFVHLSCIQEEEERLRFFRMRNQTNKLDFLLPLLSMASNQRVGSSSLSGCATFHWKIEGSGVNGGRERARFTSILPPQEGDSGGAEGKRGPCPGGWQAKIYKAAPAPRSATPPAGGLRRALNSCSSKLAAELRYELFDPPFLTYPAALLLTFNQDDR